MLNNRTKYVLVVCILLCCTYGSFAQNSIIQFPRGENFEIRIDSDKIYKTGAIDLEPGKHLIEVWSPGMRVSEDSFYVQKNLKQLFNLPAKVDSSFLKTRKDLKEYRSQVFISKVLPVMAFIGTGASSVFLYTKSRDYYFDLLNHAESYSTSSSGDFLATYNAVFQNKKQVYNRSRLFFYSMVGVTLGSATLTVFTYKMFNKNHTKPTLRPFYVSPFSGNDYSFNILVTPNQFTLKWEI